MITEMSMSDYIARKAFSGGLATRILTLSPYHAWYGSPWNPDHRSDESKAADVGTAAHAILLEGDESALAVINPEQHRSKPTKADPEGKVPTGWTNGAMRAAKAEAYAAGRTPILPEQLRGIRSMADAARNYLDTSELAGILTKGKAEQTLIWTENGVECKARPDFLTHDASICLSFKTTAGSANPDAWIRTQLPQYYIGMVLYERGVRASCNVERTRVIHLVQEQNPPYACCLVALDPAYQSVAESKLDAALTIWRECMESKHFPAYPAMICYASPPAWQLAEAEARAAETLEMA